MYSSEYVAYKHIVENEERSMKQTNYSKLSDCPKYLLPLKSKQIYEKILEANNARYTDDFILLSEFSGKKRRKEIN
jgi:hypothetical protein